MHFITLLASAINHDRITLLCIDYAQKDYLATEEECEASFAREQLVIVGFLVIDS